MTVKAILSEKGRQVITETPDATLSQICATLSTHRIGAVVLLDADQKIAGIMSERDIVRAIAAHGPDAIAHAAADYMSRNVVTCREEDTIHDVMAIMTNGRFRHMPVVRGDRLIGVVSIGDVVKRRIELVEQEAEQIRSYIASV